MVERGREGRKEGRGHELRPDEKFIVWSNSRVRERAFQLDNAETTEVHVSEARFHPTSSESSNPSLLNMNAMPAPSSFRFFLFPCKCMLAQKARPAAAGSSGPDAGAVGGNGDGDDRKAVRVRDFPVRMKHL